jgi:hypothetical protein
VAQVLIINVALFLAVLVGGVIAGWFGWRLAGGEQAEDGGGLTEIDTPVPCPRGPAPVGYRVERDDLALCA